MRRRTDRAAFAAPTLALLASTLCLLLAPSPLVAKPRYALSKGLTCAVCHVNPSGGGMRTPFGSRVFGMTELPMGYPGAGTNQLIDLEVGQSLGIGGDARLAFIDQRSPVEGSLDVQSFMLMQADLYIAAQPVENLTIYYDQGAYGSFEATAIYRQPFATWGEFLVKVGRFIPAFGLRFVNHRVFTREEIGFGPLDKDVGAELGLMLGPLFIQTAVLSGTAPARQLDDNTAKAFSGRAELLLAGDITRFMLGGSFYVNKTGQRTEALTLERIIVTDSRTDVLKLSGHAGLSVGRFNLLSEVAYFEIEPFETSSATQENSLRMLHELSVRLMRGLELLFYYEYKDPNFDASTGLATRLTAGFDYHIFPGLELYAIYRHESHTIPDGVVDPNPNFAGLNEVIAFVHGYF